MTINDKDNKSASGLNHAMLFAWGPGFWLGIRFILETLQLQYSWLAVVRWLLTLYILFSFYTATVHYKYSVLDGKITFGKAYLHILQLAILASLVGTLIKWLYLQWFDNGYLKSIYDMAMPLFEKILPNHVDELEGSLKSLLTPVRFAVNSMFSDIFMSAFFGLLLAPLAVKAKNFIPDEDNSDENDNNNE